MKNYEILAWEFEVNLKKLHFFTKIAQKGQNFPPDPPKKQQKWIFGEKVKTSYFLDSRD